MESKLKNLDSVGKLNYTGYQKLLKSNWAELIGAGEAVGFALVEGGKLPWKNATPQEKEEQPLLYLGPLTKWKTELNSSQELELTNYSYGMCKAVQVGKDVHVYLAPAKGKVTDEKHLKAIKKVLKKFKPKVFLEVVADLGAVEMSAAEVVVEEDGNLVEEFNELGKELQEYHGMTNKIKKAMEGADPAKRQQLQIKYKQILSRLKHLCASWTEDIVPQADELIQGEPALTWQKIYQKWNAYFEKRQAAKEGKSEDVEGRKLQEENLYTKTLEDLEQFFTGIENGYDLDPSVIDTNLQNLHTHVASWKAFVAGKDSQYPEELATVTAEMESLDKEWAVYQPLLQRYHKANTALEAATAANDSARVARLSKGVEKALAQINNL